MATQQATIVLTGNVGTLPSRYAQESGTPCVSFRMASTGGYWNRATSQWQEFPTTWVRVKAFWTLATNILQSLHVGDPIVVSGTLISEEWEKDGAKHTGLVILAETVGHDLNRGVSTFMRKAQHASADNHSYSTQGSGASHSDHQSHQPHGATATQDDSEFADISIDDECKATELTATHNTAAEALATAAV